jgi:CheY-like chemotaxis protein/anti-sigma regulatory factor (Ser/Thr protein kinase)
LEAAPFSLRRMMDQMSRVLAMRASEKGLCFYCRMPEETPDVVRGDRTRLQQVLLNLAGNAIKFTERGEVEVSLHALVQDGDSSVTFTVRDTGIGIAPAAQERLFQRFAQADATMARRFGGTGLGLAICKNLVELMGGRISIQSEVGKGSTFQFTVKLPLSSETPLDFESPAPFAATAAAHLRVLLVEDNPANQKLARYILQDRGHHVDIAVDGQEALHMSGQNHYDVILMDVQMPNMNGLDSTAAIRARENGNHRVPIIAMTAHAMEGDRGHCLTAGMDGYLSKPVSAHELIGLVESLARSAPPPDIDVLPLQEKPASRVVGVFNYDEALERCAESKDVLRQMIQYFFDDVNSILPQIRADMNKGNVAEIGPQAHRMIGTLVYLSANSAMQAARRLEQLCDSTEGAMLEIDEAINMLERECMMLREALVEFQTTTTDAQ